MPLSFSFAVSAPVFDSNEKIIGGSMLVGTFPEGLIGEYGLKVADKVKKISYQL